MRRRSRRTPMSKLNTRSISSNNSYAQRKLVKQDNKSQAFRQTNHAHDRNKLLSRHFTKRPVCTNRTRGKKLICNKHLGKYARIKQTVHQTPHVREKLKDQT
jgi:hypothetical protein